MTTEVIGATYDQGMFRETFEREFTYAKGVLRNTHRFADRPALLCPEQGISWTYADLGRQVHRLAHALMADGLAPGEVVMFQLLNAPAFALLYLAPKLLGAISCPINYRLSPGETATIIDDSKPTIFFYDASVREIARQALQMAHHAPRRVVGLAPDSTTEEQVSIQPDGTTEEQVSIQPGGTTRPGMTTLDAYLSGQPDTDLELEHPSTVWEETTRLYTSGTTGLPKGVPLNNLTEVLSAHDVIMHFPLSPLDRTLNMTPWFHRGGLYSGGPNPVFYVGASLVPLARFDPHRTLDWVEEYGITFLIGAPTNLEMLHDAQRRRPRDLTTLNGIVTMGAPLERDACIRYQQVLTPHIYNGYGTTEAFWNTFLRPFDLPAHAGSAGRSCTDDEVRVVKVYEDRRARPEEVVAKDGQEVGEVIVQAPGKCTYTYTNQPEQAAQTFQQGWVYIGDLGTWDQHEFVTITERKNNMIIAGGENIHPRQIEGVLREHPAVADALAVGVPDEKWGEMVAAYVVSRNAALTASDLNKYCLSHPMLARYKRPRLYRFVADLPVKANGEKDRSRAKAEAARDLSAGLFRRP